MKKLILAFWVLVMLLNSCNNEKDNGKGSKKTTRTDTIDNLASSTKSKIEDNTKFNEGKNEEIDNNYISYYNNGGVKVKGKHINGKRDGMWVSFYPNGFKQSENNYIDNILNGNSIAYYKDGKIRYKGFYLEGKKHGKWIFIDSEGNEKVIRYEHGNKKE